MTDDCYDDPVEELVVKRNKPRAIFGSALLLFAGGLFLNTTFVANGNTSGAARNAVNYRGGGKSDWFKTNA